MNVTCIWDVKIDDRTQKSLNQVTYHGLDSRGMTNPFDTGLSTLSLAGDNFFIFTD